MQKFVLNLIVMASVVALAPITARAEADQRPTASDCDKFNVGECLAEASCSFAVRHCKDHARECRDRKAMTTTAPTPSPDKPAKAAETAAPVLPPGGRWIQNEYWPEACYFVDHRVVLCDSDPTGALRAAVEAMSSPSPSKPSAPTPARAAPTRSKPDCTRLVNENHPDCRP